MNLVCPSCGAPIQFSTSIALFCVCKFCRSQVFRNDESLELLGKQAELPDDLSPMQLYSEGECFGKTFRVLGKVKLQWQDGAWNEWFLSYSDGSAGWLAEAQGKWIISTEKKDVAIPDKNEIQIGQNFKLDSILFTYADIKEAVSYGFEGELPFMSAASEKRTSVDLFSNKENRFLSFEYDDSGKRAYLGMYVTLASMKMKNLRAFNGWNS